ncbi:MAG: hypothetical protein K6E79_06440 [Pseudobutyrivibrio sp.]|nr:hypothetical protein [Pseudobutyrivibrio sp.]
MPHRKNKTYHDSNALTNWQRFLALEEKFEQAEEYVFKGADYNGKQLDLINQPVYSNQFKSIIIQASEEFILQASELVGFSGQHITIDELAEKILLLYPYIYDTVVDTNYMDVTPLIGWKNIPGRRKTLDWWGHYYKLKHGNVRDFSYATLQCTLNAMGALFVLNLYALKEEYGNIALAAQSANFRVGLK